MSLVEYHDPDGLFPLLSPHLSARLPLKNLHWKSATRPLRTISSLQVDFVPAASTSAGEAASKHSQDTVAGSDGRPSLAQGERVRRHQIPGLQQTPFLKIYLLRCDDKDAYKVSSRKLLQNWLSDNTSESRNSKRAKATEDHDAFEWLIVHVVLPETVAASQPRFSKTHPGNDTEGSRDRSTSGSKWPGGSSRTLLERLRADFNQTGKSSVDRVAQIRLQREMLPDRWLQSLPATSLTVYPETPQDWESAWSDLIGKLKISILTSFNLRVTQYEDDIRERDSQRSLPGWNFCTFFVLKDGLARTFESVGLTEDALVAYDELSVGLDTTVRDQSQNQTTPLSPFTPELRDRLYKLLADAAEESSQPKPEAEFQLKPLSLDRKDYRTLIVSNNISLFDFECYSFCRQKSLLLNLAGLPPEIREGSTGRTASPKPDVVNGTRREQSKSGEDAVRLSDLSKRSAQFSTSIARIMRGDLWASVDGEKHSYQNLALVIDILVSSWTYSVLQQILDESFLPSIPTPTSLLEAQRPKPPIRSGSFPQRQSSLAIRADRVPPPVRMEKETEELYFNEANINNIAPLKNLDAMNWMAHRADLYLLQRRILEKLDLQLKFMKVNDNQKSPDSVTELGSVDDTQLQGRAERPAPNGEIPVYLRAMEMPSLRNAVSSPENFQKLYELVTDRTAWFYTCAARKGSAETFIYDLADIRLERKDFSGASKYLAKTIPSYESKQWYTLETSFLSKYAECLKNLERRDEYIKVILTILAKSTFGRKVSSIAKNHRNGTSKNQASAHPNELKGGHDDAENYFAQLVEFSYGLPHDFSAPLQQYFEVIDIDHNIQLLDQEDGFQIRIKIKQLLAYQVSLDSIKVRLVDGAGTHSREIWVESRSKIELGADVEHVCLQSHTTTFGEFVVDKIIFQAGKILFINETVVDNNSTPTPMRRRISTAVGATRELKGPRVFCYPHADALKAILCESVTTQVGGLRALDLHLQSRRNDVIRGKIILRSASAGLRLYTADANVTNGSIEITRRSQPGEIDFGTLQPGKDGFIRIHYHSEQAKAEIFLRVEVHYSTTNGDYIFSAVPTIKPSLLLDVSVQDVFKETAIYSTFQLKSSSETGLHLLDATLESSRYFEAGPIMSHVQSCPIFPDQPVALSYRIFRKTGQQLSEKDGTNDAALLFTVKYRHVEDDILSQCSTALEGKLKQSPFAAMRDLPLHTFKSILQRSLTYIDYERATSWGEITLPPFHAATWSNTTKCLSKDVQKDLLQWLQDWHEQNRTLLLLTPEDHSYVDLFPARQLIVKFDVPELQFLHTASLRVLEMHSTSTLNSFVVAAGQPLMAELRIRHTRRWSTTMAPNANLPDTMGFVYEILADAAQWLVGGQRRVQFEAEEDEELVFGLILIPLLPGQLFLPMVEVQPLSRNDDPSVNEDDRGKVGDQDNFNCQTDCISQSRTVLVVENMRSATVSIGQDDVLTRQVGLIETEARAHTAVG